MSTLHSQRCLHQLTDELVCVIEKDGTRGLLVAPAEEPTKLKSGSGGSAHMCGHDSWRYHRLSLRL